ncbi:hypothetical protein FQB35_00200 [Crassaminicella thermophila]|uniref:Uncharacterized protein n=2 Tax=Crassaminicella thermophila TaxID=2599308 RepID=A0A5C0SAA8_CRATE|nr:hypothetical protein FQB35_00200 [Crassaminicella thermophila]
MFLPSCVKHRTLDSNQIAVVNGHIITVEDIQKKLKTFQLEKDLYMYNSFKNNIYPNLELLHLRQDHIDYVINLLKNKKLEDARNFIASLNGYKDVEALRYFLLKEIDVYEEILNKQNNVIAAFEEALKDVIILQEAKSRSLLPTKNELEKAYETYLCNIQEKIDENIYYQYFYSFMKTREKELFQLDTEEAYRNYLFEKIKYSIIKKRLKKEIGSYKFNHFIKNKLKESNILLNEKYKTYQNNSKS